MQDTIAQDAVHATVGRRSRNIGAFNYVSWTIGFVSTFMLLSATGSYVSFLVAPIGILVGFPVKDAGSPHMWLMRKWTAMRTTRENGGVLQAPPFSRHGRKFASPWDDVEITHGVFSDSKGNLLSIPLATTKAHTHLTAYIGLTDGAAEEWLGSDGEGKYDWDTRFAAALGKAFGSSKVADIYYASTAIYRPADRTPGFEYNQARLNEQIMEAADADSPNGQFDTTDMTLGRNIVERHDMVYAPGRAGNTTNVIALRMPWPRTWTGRRARVDQEKVFSKLPLRTTLGKLLNELRGVGLTASYLSTHEVVDLFHAALNVTLLPVRQTYSQRDRELVQTKIVDHIDETPGAGPDSWKPLSTTTVPGYPGMICCNGTYHLGAMLDNLTREQLRPGFQERALVLSSDTYYTASTLCAAIPMAPEKLKATGRELAGTLMPSVSDVNPNLTDADKERLVAQNEEMVRRLADGGKRAAHYYLPFIMSDVDPDDLMRKWDDSLVEMASVYEYKQLMAANEVIDAIKAQWCLGEF